MSETRQYWYLIENENTEWFKAMFYWDKSNPSQVVGRMCPKWIKDATQATLFPTKRDAEIYNRKHELNGKITEHEFVNP